MSDILEKLIWTVALLFITFLPNIIINNISPRAWEYILVLRRTTKICYWFSVSCCVTTFLLTALSIFIELESNCTEKLLRNYSEHINAVRVAAIVGSVFTVIGFASTRSERSLSAYNDLLNQAQFQSTRYNRNSIVVTDAHLIIFAPIYAFLGISLAIPISLLVLIRKILVLCGKS